MAIDDPLIATSDLSKWTRSDIEPDDDWAKVSIKVASALVREQAHQPDWTLATAPAMAKIVVAGCAMRGYVNPPEGESSSSVGPLGSRLLDAVAEGFYLTDEEKSRLSAYAPAEVASAGSRLWITSMEGEEPEPPSGDVLVYGVQPGADPVVLGDAVVDAVTYGLRPPVTYLPGEAPGVVRVVYNRRTGMGSP